MLRIDFPVNMDTPFKGVSWFTQQAQWNLMNAHNIIIDHHVVQVFQANKKCQESNIYAANDSIYLSTQNLTQLKGGARKLVP